MAAIVKDRMRSIGDNRQDAVAGTVDVGEQALTPADPLADGRVWLASMERSMLRASQQAALQLVQVDPKTPSRLNSSTSFCLRCW
jgi:hypothetical protein